MRAGRCRRLRHQRSRRADGVLDDEDPKLFDAKVLETAPTTYRSDVLERDPGSEQCIPDSVALAQEASEELKCLFLQPYASPLIVDRWHTKCRELLSAQVKCSVTLVTCETPYEDEDKSEPYGYWVRPQHKDVDTRRKILRKQLFAAVVMILNLRTICSVSI